MSVSDSMLEKFSWGQKACDYIGKCDLLECDYYEWGGRSMKSSTSMPINRFLFNFS